MIKNLVASCLLAANVNTTPIKRNNQQWQTNYHFIITNQDEVNRTQSIADTKLYKIKYQKFNDYLQVNATLYLQESNTQQLVFGYKNQALTINNLGTQGNGLNAKALLIFQINPTNVNINNTMNLEYNTGVFTSNNPSGTVIEENVLVYEKIQTTRSLANYLDLTLNVGNYNRDLTTTYLELKDVNNGYQTNITNAYNYANDDDEEDAVIMQNYRITPNKTNYYAIYMEPRVWLTNDAQADTLAFDLGFHAQNPIWDTMLTNTQIMSFYGINVISNGTQEIVDIPGTMIDVIGMPFTFISTAFNLTLFPGTAYELNISVLFLTLFAILSFVFILKIFLRMKG